MVVRATASNPDIIRWARERAGFGVEDLLDRFPRLSAWESGDAVPTLKQLENYARATHVPVGYLFLDEPVAEAVPMSDFRTMQSSVPSRPSPDLLDTMYLCQQRQEWYRGFARTIGGEPLQFVGSLNVDWKIEAAADTMRRDLGLDLEKRRLLGGWAEALGDLVDQAESLGVLVMMSGIVGSNTHRKLDPEEFRGFALADDLAPLVFINGADTKAAQIFTLAHEFVHIWLGVSAVSNASLSVVPKQRVERWCNRVAAEILVPARVIRNEFREGHPLSDEMGRLARTFKVSTLVILRSLHDIGIITDDLYWEAYHQELQRLLSQPRGQGGNFYATTDVRVSRRFARALIANTLEERTLYRDAFQMLGISKTQTFRELGRLLGIG